jgi:hypothetical protein
MTRDSYQRPMRLGQVKRDLAVFRKYLRSRWESDATSHSTIVHLVTVSHVYDI